MIYFVTNQTELFNNDKYKVIGVEESLSLLSPLTEISTDTETEGLDEYTKDLLSVQLGNKEFQVVIDCKTVDITLYKELFESSRIFLFWNALFDLRFFYRKNIYIRNVWDGFLAEKLMWLGYPAGIHSMSLKSAGENYLGIGLDKSIRGRIIYQGLTEETIVYGANDVKYLEEIKKKQLEELSKRDLLRAIDIENRFVLVLAYCQHCGIKLDLNKWKTKMKKDKDREEKAIKSLNDWLISNEPNSKYIFVDRQGDLFNGFNLSPQININWNSVKQVAEILKKYDVNVYIDDKKGGVKDSIDAKVLKPQKDKCSLIPLYLNYKEAAKVTSTYGENFVKQINPISNRIHTNYSQLGADTTRITSGGKDKSNNTEYVNLLNLPADAETRACFVAEEGNKWISIDYSGQESFLMASIANDKAIIHELTEGDKDLHTLTAKIVFDYIPKDMPAKEVKSKFHTERQLSKGYEFAFNYAGNAETIKRNFGLTDEEANRIYNAYMSGFDGLKRYQDFRRKDWWDKGYILLSPLTGHKAYIYDWKSLKEDQESFKEPGFWDHYRDMKKTDPQSYTVEKVRHFFKRKSTSDRQSVNYPIQAAGSMCLRLALIHFFYYLRDNNLLGIVKICVCPYDEVNCEAPKDIAEDIARILYGYMVKSGSYFCTRCKLDADISRLEDGSLPTYWIH